MCGGAPEIPAMPPPPPAPPMPPPAPEPAAPLPPPQAVTAGDKDAAKVQKRTSQRAALQQASKGTGALTIPLSTGQAPAAGSKPAALNIPK
jgi:hypothetical protein